MSLTRCRKTLCVLALIVSSTLTGCMAHRPAQYSRRSFHAALERQKSTPISQAQLARWHQKHDAQLVASATATANSPKELDASGR